MDIERDSSSLADLPNAVLSVIAGLLDLRSAAAFQAASRICRQPVREVLENVKHVVLSPAASGAQEPVLPPARTLQPARQGPSGSDESCVKGLGASSRGPSALAAQYHPEEPGFDFEGWHQELGQCPDPSSTGPAGSMQGAQHHVVVAAHGPSPSGLPCLRWVMANCGNLHTLDLSSCFKWFDSGAATFLGAHAPSTLAVLRLDNCCKLGAAGLQAMCAGGRLKNVEKLSLKGCGSIGDGSPLTALTGLTALDCTWCTSLTTQGLWGVANRLLDACFQGCELLDDELCKGMQDVRRVNLAFTRVTDAGLMSLATCCPHLSSITLGALNHNIFNAGFYTEVGLSNVMAMRRKLTFTLISA